MYSVCVRCPWRSEESTGSPELVLQMVMSCGVLRIHSGPLQRETNVLNHQAISPTLSGNSLWDMQDIFRKYKQVEPHSNKYSEFTQCKEKLIFIL